VPVPNALVDLPLFPGASGEIVVNPAAGSISSQFTLRPATPGSPMTLPMDVFDACGAWTTLVGDGSGGIVNGGASASSGAGIGSSAGTVTLAGPPPSVVSDLTPAAAASAPDARVENVERPPKLTAQQRWQQARTNAGSREDERIEGNVLAVNCADRTPTLTIGNRDGEVTLELRGEAAGDCEQIRPGQYVLADGEKVHEQRFLADRVSVE
jgi:hypothetical protein